LPGHVALSGLARRPPNHPLAGGFGRPNAATASAGLMMLRAARTWPLSMTSRLQA
jgi:hypothetical protein